jgi:hypothetical protein
MEYEITYSKPHSVLLSDTKKNELNIGEGDPIELDLEGIDGRTVFKCGSLSDINYHRENLALFFTLHYCLDNLESYHNGLFSEFEGTDFSTRENDSIESSNDLSSYFTKIDHVNEHRISETDIAIGCGIADLHFSSDANQQVESPYSIHCKQVVTDGLSKSLPEIQNITRYNGPLKTPEKITFCSYSINTTDPVENTIKDNISSEKYIVPEFAYEHNFGLISTHGAVDHMGDDGPVLVATNENIDIVSNSVFSLGIIGALDMSIDHLEDFFNEKFGELDVGTDWEVDEKQINVAFEGRESIKMYYSDDYLWATFSHIINNKESVEQSLFSTLSSWINDNYEAEVQIRSWSNPPSEALTADSWVLDTNSIYRQRPDQSYNAITSFIINNPIIVNKKITIPWNVVCEINKHKDQGTTSTKNASKQGLDNLLILKTLNEFNIIELDVETPPKDIDNSIRDDLGATDLAIVNRVPEDGVLFTDDEQLIKICELFDINTEQMKNISNLDSDDPNDQIWDLAKTENLANGPAMFENLDESIDGYIGQNDELSVEKTSSEIISDKLRNSELMEVASDGDVLLALTKEIEIVPTMSFLNELSECIVEINNNKYITDKTLEKIRASVGGMPTSHRPKLTFIVPSEYILRSSELHHMETLEHLTAVENINMRAENTHGERSDTVEQLAIDLSAEEGCSILCTSEENIRMYRLLDVNYCIVDL